MWKPLLKQTDKTSNSFSYDDWSMKNNYHLSRIRRGGKMQFTIFFERKMQFTMFNFSSYPHWLTTNNPNVVCIYKMLLTEGNTSPGYLLIVYLRKYLIYWVTKLSESYPTNNCVKMKLWWVRKGLKLPTYYSSFIQLEVNKDYPIG